MIRCIAFLIVAFLPLVAYGPDEFSTGKEPVVPDYFALLGVTPQATTREVTEAYTREISKASSKADERTLDEALRTLVDESRRVAYIGKLNRQKEDARFKQLVESNDVLTDALAHVRIRQGERADLQALLALQQLSERMGAAERASDQPLLRGFAQSLTGAAKAEFGNKELILKLELARRVDEFLAASPSIEQVNALVSSFEGVHGAGGLYIMNDTIPPDMTEAVDKALEYGFSKPANRVNFEKLLIRALGQGTLQGRLQNWSPEAIQQIAKLHQQHFGESINGTAEKLAKVLLNSKTGARDKLVKFNGLVPLLDAQQATSMLEQFYRLHSSRELGKMGKDEYVQTYGPYFQRILDRLDSVHPNRPKEPLRDSPFQSFLRKIKVSPALDDCDLAWRAIHSKRFDIPPGSK